MSPPDPACGCAPCLPEATKTRLRLLNPDSKPRAGQPPPRWPQDWLEGPLTYQAPPLLTAKRTQKPHHQTQPKLAPCCPATPSQGARRGLRLCEHRLRYSHGTGEKAVSVAHCDQALTASRARLLPCPPLSVVQAERGRCVLAGQLEPGRLEGPRSQAAPAAGPVNANPNSLLGTSAPAT